MKSKVYHLEIIQRKYVDNPREGGHYTEVLRIPTSGGVPATEVKTLVRKFISEAVSTPHCGLVFSKKHVSLLSEGWDDEGCSAERLVQIWNVAQPSMKVEITEEEAYPSFPISMRIAKDRKNRYCWYVRASDDAGCTWKNVLFSDNPEIAQEVCFSGKQANPHKLFSLVYAPFEDAI